MKKTVIALVSLAGAALLSGCNQQTASVPNTAGATNVMSTPGATAAAAAAPTNLLNDDTARESYAVGMYMGHGWKTHDVHLDLDMVFRGIEDEVSNSPTLLTEDQMGASLRQLQQGLAMAHQKEQSQEAQINMQEGEKFLAENKTKPGVVTLPDGLQYKIITEGKGPSPGLNDTVEVNYTGTFINGTVFDSSERNGPGHPAQFPVHAVIPGWTEGLQKMKVGSKWYFYIPSNLAYGPMGPPAIGPNRTLIFQVELLGIKPGPAPAPPPQPLTSDIIKVPSAEEMKKGAQIETIKASDLPKMQQAATNQ
jgi:FKBP-type peptidyl-prolyl cis-trans isomerase